MLATTISVYGHRAETSARLSTQAQVGLVQVALIADGTAIGSTGSGWSVVLATTAVAGALTALADLRRWTPPGCLFFVFTIGSCASAPASPRDALAAAAVAATAVLWTLLVTVVGSLIERRRPAVDLRRRADQRPAMRPRPA